MDNQRKIILLVTLLSVVPMTITNETDEEQAAPRIFTNGHAGFQFREAAHAERDYQTRKSIRDSIRLQNLKENRQTQDDMLLLKPNSEHPKTYLKPPNRRKVSAISKSNIKSTNEEINFNKNVSSSGKINDSELNAKLDFNKTNISTSELNNNTRDYNAPVVEIDGTKSVLVSPTTYFEDNILNSNRRIDSASIDYDAVGTTLKKVDYNHNEHSLINSRFETNNSPSKISNKKAYDQSVMKVDLITEDSKNIQFSFGNNKNISLEVGIVNSSNKPIESASIEKQVIEESINNKATNDSNTNLASLLIDKEMHKEVNNGVIRLDNGDKNISSDDIQIIKEKQDKNIVDSITPKNMFLIGSNKKITTSSTEIPISNATNKFRKLYELRRKGVAQRIASRLASLSESTRKSSIAVKINRHKYFSRLQSTSPASTRIQTTEPTSIPEKLVNNFSSNRRIGITSKIILGNEQNNKTAEIPSSYDQTNTLPDNKISSLEENNVISKSSDNAIRRRFNKYKVRAKTNTQNIVDQMNNSSVKRKRFTPPAVDRTEQRKKTIALYAKRKPTGTIVELYRHKVRNQTESTTVGSSS